MNRSEWSAPTTPDEVARRAAGRRHYNEVRQFNAALRRIEVMRRFNEYGGFATRGVVSRIAAELGVHRSTVSRDIWKILPPDEQACPTCHRLMKNVDWDRLIKRPQRRTPRQTYSSEMRTLYLPWRRNKILRRLDEYGGVGTRGVQVRIARELDIHPSTVCREVRKAMAPNGRPCSTCGRYMQNEGWDRLDSLTRFWVARAG